MLYLTDQPTEPRLPRRMVRRLAFLVFIGTAALASGSCGSAPQVSGDWSGGVRPNHLDILQIRITQDGKIIRGTACYAIGNGVPAQIVFRDATVTGSYPTIRVVAPTYQGGWTFEGEFQDDGLLTGAYHGGTNPPYPMYLTRGIGPIASCVAP
jgi:hypothetical protein